MKWILALNVVLLLPVRAAEPPASGFARTTSFFAKLDTNKIHYASLGNGSNTIVATAAGASPMAHRVQEPQDQGRLCNAESRRCRQPGHPLAVRAAVCGSPVPCEAKRSARPNPSLQPTRYGWLRQPARAAELKR